MEADSLTMEECSLGMEGCDQGMAEACLEMVAFGTIKMVDGTRAILEGIQTMAGTKATDPNMDARAKGSPTTTLVVISIIDSMETSKC